MFIRNAWYVVAWDFEVLADTILARTVLGDSIVVYRKTDGTPVVMENRCCHRGAPLALGRKEGDCIRCMYHGMKFDASGVCIEVPGQTLIPPKAKVRTYPVVQRTRWIWVWMGDPALADATLIPDTYSIQHPKWRTKPGYKHFGANVLLICDNLLDFSHLAYVHERTFGGSTAIAEVRHEVTKLDHGIRIVRKVPDTVPAPYHQRLGNFTGRVNRWFDYTLSVTGMFIMTAGVQSVDKAADDPDGALVFHSCQALTPETGDATHYFFSHANNFALDDATVTEASYQSVAAAFDEDMRMIQAQAKVLAQDSDRPLVQIAADLALTQYRQMVATALAAETDAIRHRA